MPSSPPPADPAGAGAGPLAVVALAASLGGVRALGVVLGGLPAGLPAAVLVVQHEAERRPSAARPGVRRPSLLAAVLAGSPLPVAEAAHGQRLRAGRVYLAPPGRHLRVCPGGTLALSDEPRMKHVRPSADLLFQSLAEACGPRAIAVVLTGRLGDGSGGVGAVKAGGGTVIAQDRASSLDFSMPESAIRTGAVDAVLPLDQIAPCIVNLLSHGASRG